MSKPDTDVQPSYLFVTLLFLSLSFITVIHSLRYFYSASSGLPDIPSYMSAGFLDDVQISYCDSRNNRNIPKQDWMNNVSSDNPHYWEEETLTQGWPILVLEGRCPAALRRLPGPTHLDPIAEPPPKCSQVLQSPLTLKLNYHELFVYLTKLLGFIFHH
uniref:MHC class I-like antigen recognition-like domain-containing protein n=1 Tax=Poecilia mexicana TaxID=48701 RepID=A0A3B3X8Z2_9TELE